MRRFATFLVLVLSGCAPSAAVAQCSGGSCASGFQGAVAPRYYVTPSYTPVVATPTWEWKKVEQYPDQLFLFKDGVQVGALDTLEGYYRPYDGSTWGPKGKVDVARIKAKPQDLEVVPHTRVQDYPTGVVWDRIGERENYRCRDRDSMTKSEALSLVGKIPDYSQKKYFTVIGTESECKEVIASLNSTEFKDQYVVNEYRPNDWQLRPGFPQRFAVLLQDKPDARGYGKVLMYLESLPSQAQLAEGLRRSDPNSDPNKWPNPLKPKPPEPQPVKPDDVINTPVSSLRGYLWPLGFVAALALLYFKRS